MRWGQRAFADKSLRRLRRRSSEQQAITYSPMIRRLHTGLGIPAEALIS
jgi:antitoxin component HigA of HigAB toxin-antitoxin module